MPAKRRDQDSTLSFSRITSGARISHYRILTLIGTGAMGEVYLARDASLGRLVALKFLAARYCAESSFRSRLVREARSAARLNHTNIVTIYEVGQHDHRVYIAMEYVDGQSLRDVVLRAPLGLNKALDILLQLCVGLKEAHDAGIVHRDIKPTNIVIDRKGRCRILDFGLAMTYGDSEMSSPGAVVGTASYMSPEQGQGLEVDPRSDIFSLGVVFYEMLSGRSPFKRDNLPAAIHAVVHEHPDEITNFFDADSDLWQRVIDKMLAKSAAERYQDIDQLLADLKRLQDSGLLRETPNGGAMVQQPTNSLAVLCLRNLGSPDDDYLSYGITEDLIVDLTRIGSLRVAPMRSVLKFKDSELDLADIAKALDVSMILDGSIHKTKSNIRASAQLIDVASGKNLWADRWQETLDRLHLVKTALAEGVSRALGVDSTVVEAAQVGEPEACGPKAYEYYLRGKYTYEHRHSAFDVKVASDLYQQALRLEPSLLAARAGIAEILMFEGRHEDAIQKLLAALAELRQWGQRAEEGRILLLLARCFSEQSMWDEAANFAEEAVRASKKMGDMAGEAAALGILIKTRQRRAMFDEALELFHRINEINHRLHDRYKEAEALNLIGTVHFQKGDCATALEMYQGALEIAEAREQTALEATCIGNIGMTYIYLGDHEMALEYCERSVQMFSDLGDAARKAAAVNNVAMLHESSGEYDKAIEMYRDASSIHERYGERGGCALTINNTAYIMIILGRYDEAVAELTRALDITRDLDYPFVTAYANANLGFAHFCRGENSLATEKLKMAIEVAREFGLRREEAVALSFLGEVCYLTDRVEECYRHFEQSRALAKEVGHRYTFLKSEAYLATRRTSADMATADVQRGRQIVDDAEKDGDPRLVLLTKRLLAESLARFSSSSEGHQEGILMLRKLLPYALDKQVAYEAAWIESALKRLSEPP